MLIYNKYINKSFKNKPYETEVCFVNINEGINGDNDNILIQDLAYIQFNDNKLDGLYKLPNDLMINIKRGKKNKINFVESNEDLIHKISLVTYYFIYVKVIDDKINPHLNGKFLILKLTSGLFRTISVTENTPKLYNNTFKLIVKPLTDMEYPHYDHSYYTDKKMSVDNFNLSLKKTLKFKHFDPIQLRRKLKLDKILKNGTLQ